MTEVEEVSGYWGGSRVSYTLDFYPEEMADAKDIDNYFGSIKDIQTLEKAKEVMELYVKKGFKVALYEVRCKETRLWVVK